MKRDAAAGRSKIEDTFPDNTTIQKDFVFNEVFLRRPTRPDVEAKMEIHFCAD